MAKPIKLRKGQEFHFAPPKKGGGGEAKYPWDTWLNGDLLLLERSEGVENDKGTIESPTVKKDFEVSINAMLPKLKVAGRKKYKVVMVSKVDADGKPLNNSIIINARDMDAAERAEEDKQRLLDKAKVAERRAADKAKTNGQATAATDAPTAAPLDATPVAT